VTANARAGSPCLTRPADFSTLSEGSDSRFDGPMARCEISVSYRKQLLAPAKFVASLRYGLTPETPAGGFVPVGNCFEHLQALTTRLRVRFQWARLITLAALIASRSAFAGEPTTEPLLRLETDNHTALIRRIATDSAGRWAVTASEDKTARVWEASTGRQVMILRPPQDIGEEGELCAVAMSPDGSTVALGGWTGYDWDQSNSIYLFDRETGRLVRRIPGLPNVIYHLAYAPNGRWLAASLWGKNGVRLFDAAAGDEVGRDAGYNDQSYSAHFRHDSQRLVTTSLDGMVRLYSVDEKGLRLLKAKKSEGGKKPFFARFSPDGRMIAVGFDDTTVVQLLDATTLSEVARPSTEGIENGNLITVAWSANGTYLLAAGKWQLDGRFTVRRWAVGNWTQYEDVPLSNNTIMDLVALPDGRMLFATQGNPAWGILGADGQVEWQKASVLVDFRNQDDQLRVSADGRRVRFGYLPWGKDACTFDLVNGTLGPDDPDLPAARTDAPELKIEHWKHYTNPTLNGKELKLQPYEASRSVAISPDGSRFALGADWSLRLFDRQGAEVWSKPVPGAAWAVTISEDGRFVVAGYGDGTIRWHRISDGKEVLAFFPHNDRKRWIAWTPEGFFSASLGAEDLIGYHLNRGKDQEGEFISARQLWETFYQPGLIAGRLEPGGDERIAAAVKQRGDVRELLSAGQTPELELVSPAKAQSEGTYTLKVRVKKAGGGESRLVVRVDGQELKGRWQAPALTPGGLITLPVDLAAGERSVSVELLDGRGVGSKPVEARVNVRHPADGEGPALHVLAVGVSKYRDRALGEGVTFAAQDAGDVAAAFKRGSRGLYREARTETLADSNATRDQIVQVAKQMAATVRPQDVFILYLAGHGASLDGEYYFIPWEARYTNREVLMQQSLSGEKLREILAGIPATKTLVLLDTCSSGRFSLVAARQLDDKTAIERLQRISGRAVIAAAADEKMALEGEGKHGVFTYALLQALDGDADSDKDRFVSVSELASYIDQKLPEITNRKWGYEQFPFMQTEGNVFPVVRRGE
jgi:WD40 repeat protein